MVCPYSWDVPGGVQFHIQDLAEQLIKLGHQVSVLTPADAETKIPPYMVAAGRAVPVPYNGSIARLSFGFVAAARVRRWLQEGEFDVLHVHEPSAPSLSLLACWAAICPIVATLHTANPRSRAMTAAAPILQLAMEKINARIAVSEYARRTMVEHFGGDAVVIPNGVDSAYFANAEKVPEWMTPVGEAAEDGEGGTIGFLGRFEEPRKGLQVLLKAFPKIVAARPKARLLVAGRGDADEAMRSLPEHVRSQVTFAGMVPGRDRARVLRSVDVYCAPNTGGESFGVILVEAMSAGTPVLASDLHAFSLVLEGGAVGDMFPNGDADALAEAAIRLLGDPARRREMRDKATAAVRRRYDWSVIVPEIVTIYELIIESNPRMPGSPPGMSQPERQGDFYRTWALPSRRPRPHSFMSLANNAADWPPVCAR
jgi:phosphatidylinositol alpha-mannosyltransferase